MFSVFFMAAMTQTAFLDASEKHRPSPEVFKWFSRSELRLVAERIIAAYRDDHPNSLEKLRVLVAHLKNIDERLVQSAADGIAPAHEIENIDTVLWNRIAEVRLIAHHRMSREQRFMWLISLMSGDLNQKLVQEPGPVRDLMTTLRLSSILESTEEVEEPKPDSEKEIIDDDRDILESYAFEEIQPVRVPQDPHFLLQFFPAVRPPNKIYFLSPQGVSAALLTDALERALAEFVERRLRARVDDLDAITNENFAPVPLFDVKPVARQNEDEFTDQRLELTIFIQDKPKYELAPVQGKMVRVEISIPKLYGPVLGLKDVELSGVARQFMQHKDLCRRMIARSIVR
jgi:hypothetical protein